MQGAVAEKMDFQFRRGHFTLVPYRVDDGSTSQQGLVDLYFRIHQDGLQEIVFHENPEMTLLQFMNFMSSPRTFLSVFALMDEQTDSVVDVVGMAWLSETQNCCGGTLNKAIGSFLFFKNYQKPAYTDPCHEILFDYWFNLLGLHTLVGLTPEPNRAALLFVKRLGLKEICRIPRYTTYEGKVCAGVVSQLTSEDYFSGLRS